MLEERDLGTISAELEGVVAMDAVFDQRWVSRLDGVRVKPAASKWDQAQALMDDIENFRSANSCDRLVMVWCGSTEAFSEPTAVHESVKAFEAGLKADDDAIAPSQIYAYAALQSDVPFANGAPNLTVDLPCMEELSRVRGVPIAGKDFKTGQTLMKTLIAPGLKARMLGLRGWYSTNILGNRDGEVLDAPENFKSKEVSKLGVLDTILQPDLYPDLYNEIHHVVRINYYPPRGDNKEGWDSIDIFGWLGYPMHDQGGLPLPRLDPGRPHRARPGPLHGPGRPGRRVRRAGMAQLLLQGAPARRRGRCGARPVHPADQAQEHPAGVDGREARNPQRNRLSPPPGAGSGAASPQYPRGREPSGKVASQLLELATVIRLGGFDPAQHLLDLTELCERGLLEPGRALAKPANALAKSPNALAKSPNALAKSPNALAVGLDVGSHALEYEAESSDGGGAQQANDGSSNRSIHGRAY